ncbi:MAG: hypothetical protein NXY57DRAFT_907953 [Lentinula lateritia]|nr:MAG: hypothetical protein NXY57DRAFT_907953 [Lentinula lateritia]
MSQRLRRLKWAVLLYVCNDLMVFPPQTYHILQRLDSMTKNDITISGMVEALIDWRLNGVSEDCPFVWPHFTPYHGLPPKAPWSGPVITPSHRHNATYHNLTEADKEIFMQGIAETMNYNSAVGIGHVHELLWQPIDDTDIGKEKLAKSLKANSRHALLYVCTDLNRLPTNSSIKNISKNDLIYQLVDWVR